jgi:hypothetical protein
MTGLRIAELIIILLCLGTGIICAGGILMNRPERPKARHTARALRQSEDDKTVTWLAGLKRPLRRIPPLALARVRVAALLAVLPARDGEPRCGAPGCGRPIDVGCRHITPADMSGWMTAPGPWDAPGRPAETLAQLPPNAAAGLWRPRAVPPADRPWLPATLQMHARPDVEDLDDTGTMAALVDWATTAPLGEVRHG